MIETETRTTSGAAASLPPGQRVIDWFPRFGTRLSGPAPTIPDDPVIKVGGAVTEAFAVPIADLAGYPRRQLHADFHCVSGWTSLGLRWEGVAFAEFYRSSIEPTLRPGAVITHVEFRGLDGFNSVVTIEDALDDDVLLADHLDGAPLGTDHGAPLRVVSPAQYGYISTKHLCRIDVHTAEPSGSSSVVRAGRAPALPSQGEGRPRGAPWVGPRPRGPAGLPSRCGGDAAPQPTYVDRRRPTELGRRGEPGDDRGAQVRPPRARPPTPPGVADRVLAPRHLARARRRVLMRGVGRQGRSVVPMARRPASRAAGMIDGSPRRHSTVSRTPVSSHPQGPVDDRTSSSS